MERAMAMNDQILMQRIREIEKSVLRCAKEGAGAMPQMTLNDTVLFIGLKYLYIASQHHLVCREELTAEKKRLIASYKIAALDDEAYMEMARRRNAISSQMVRLEKCGCAACRDMIKLIDGRK